MKSEIRNVDVELFDDGNTLSLIVDDWYVLELTKDGKIRLYAGVDDELFQVDEDGYIDVERA